MPRKLYAPQFIIASSRRATKRPSRVAASAMRWIWSRACGAAPRFSLRLSTQRTGRASSRAAKATSMSSADCTPFCPKPPPTSQAMTRMLSAGMQSETAISICSTWAVCVALRDELFLHRDEVAPLEGFLGIALGDSHREHEIAAELRLHQRGIGLERRDRVGHCRQLLVIDFDQLHRVERLRQRFSDYHG